MANGSYAGIDTKSTATKSKTKNVCLRQKLPHPWAGRLSRPSLAAYSRYPGLRAAVLQPVIMSLCAAILLITPVCQT